jgi:hypothetical protein
MLLPHCSKREEEILRLVTSIFGAVMGKLQVYGLEICIKRTQRATAGVAMLDWSNITKFNCRTDFDLKSDFPAHSKLKSPVDPTAPCAPKTSFGPLS